MLTLEALTTVITGIILPTILVTLLTFVPSIIEWKKPRDAGPRPIAGFYKTGHLNPKSSLHEVDTEIGVHLIPKGFNFPANISNIEV